MRTAQPIEIRGSIQFRREVAGVSYHIGVTLEGDVEKTPATDTDPPSKEITISDLLVDFVESNDEIWEGCWPPCMTLEDIQSWAEEEIFAGALQY